MNQRELLREQVEDLKEERNSSLEFMLEVVIIFLILCEIILDFPPSGYWWNCFNSMEHMALSIIVVWIIICTGYFLWKSKNKYDQHIINLKEQIEKIDKNLLNKTNP